MNTASYQITLVLASLIASSAQALSPPAEKIQYRCQNRSAGSGELNVSLDLYPGDPDAEDAAQARSRVVVEGLPASPRLVGYYRIAGENNPPLEELQSAALRELGLREWDLDEVLLAQAAESEDDALVKFWLHSIRTRSDVTGKLQFSGAYGSFEGQNFLCTATPLLATSR